MALQHAGFISFNRVALPVAMAAAAGLVKVWPILRLRRRTGRWPVGGRPTTARQRTDEIPRGYDRRATIAIASVIGLLNLAQLAWVSLYAALGPEPLGVWPTPSWVDIGGWALVLCGCALIVAGQRAMGDSWRMGTSQEHRPLVTRGPYRLIRHPIYAGWLLMLAGIAAVTPAIWSIAGFAAFAAVVVLQSRREERLLTQRTDGEYAAYSAATGGFIPRWPRGSRRRALPSSAHCSQSPASTTAPIPSPSASASQSPHESTRTAP